ncbi:CLUMA_CG012235, isoform A [Clunio marinus]|uniref:CLUMA_CG012235, isoform A n=1 Tax=Clunio marinus TaxID=568069 RepID=A0A1J1IH04_9DIPT|nr:CLUMA_CG012235, isoform A [Clunio marinus]
MQVTPNAALSVKVSIKNEEKVTVLTSLLLAITVIDYKRSPQAIEVAFRLDERLKQLQMKRHHQPSVLIYKKSLFYCIIV